MIFSLISLILISFLVLKFYWTKNNGKFIFVNVNYIKLNFIFKNSDFQLISTNKYIGFFSKFLNNDSNVFYSDSTFPNSVMVDINNPIIASLLLIKQTEVFSSFDISERRAILALIFSFPLTKENFLLYGICDRNLYTKYIKLYESNAFSP